MRAPALRYKAYSASALAIKVEGLHLLSIIEIRGPEEMILSNQGVGEMFLEVFSTIFLYSPNLGLETLGHQSRER